MIIMVHAGVPHLQALLLQFDNNHESKDENSYFDIFDEALHFFGFWFSFLFAEHSNNIRILRKLKLFFV